MIHWYLSIHWLMSLMMQLCSSPQLWSAGTFLSIAIVNQCIHHQQTMNIMFSTSRWEICSRCCTHTRTHSSYPLSSGVNLYLPTIFSIVERIFWRTQHVLDFPEEPPAYGRGISSAIDHWMPLPLVHAKGGMAPISLHLFIDSCWFLTYIGTLWNLLYLVMKFNSFTPCCNSLT